MYPETLSLTRSLIYSMLRIYSPLKPVLKLPCDKEV